MIEVRVPATSANIGPGFDCLGLALNMYNYFKIEEIESGLEICGCEEQYRNESNLVYTSMLKCFEITGYRPKGLKIEIDGDIPTSRGLGSSAACILGGVLAANEISGGKLSKNEILQIAADIEGHPDNISPALLGGMVISITDNGKVYYDKIKISEGLKFCAIIPDFTLLTKEARAVLPDSIPHKDGVFNTGRASLLISALVNGSFDLIKIACDDRLHQIYRGKLIANYDEIVEKSRMLNCLGVFLSGAGPSIMVILKEENMDFCKDMGIFLKTLENKWSIKELKLDIQGSVVKRL